MHKIMIIAGLDRSLLLFRSELIKEWLSMGLEVTAAAPGDDIKNRLEQMGAKYVSIPLNRAGLNPIKDIYLMASLMRLLRKERPDYLFLYTIKPVIYGSLASIVLPTCNIFSMITGLGYVFIAQKGKDWFLKKLVSLLYRAALRRNRNVFFQNPDDAGEFINLGIVEEGKVVLVNGSGVDTDYYYLAPLLEKPVTFILIARLLIEKGIVEYVEAARLVKNCYSEAVFKLIGWPLEGDLSVIKFEKVEKWKEEGVVEILGETDDVRPFIAGSSVYVLPSYREGTPRTVLEAMSMGRAIITTDAPGCRETVVNNVNGFLVPVKDVEALAGAMEEFILEPDLIVNMGRESRQLAEEKYDVRKVNRAINKTMGIG